MSPHDDREFRRRVTLNRIDLTQRRLYAAESALALRAGLYNEAPPWRVAETIRARGRFLRALDRAIEFRRSLRIDLAVLGAQGMAGLAREIKREARRGVVRARAGAKSRSREAVLAN
ncbi:hypothetical protein P12x_003027 [Tundrisphaera lichenicola]|uniref:hypothetical protein n=1 Tax=Tundrisphaera lichenicola TaxID=2029860 RepID=UPI003EBA514A